jgi:TMEM175 potassium channel family protein
MKQLATTKKDRLEMFSDGVFAIAITLLILEIKIPTHEQLEHAGGLYKYLFSIWPSYVSYLMSAALIGIYWVNHHWLFGFIEKTNHVFNLLNVLFLIAIIFIPFTSAIFGDFVINEEYRHAAATTYCVGYFIPVGPTLLLCRYAMHKKRLVNPRLSQKFIKRFTYKLLVLFLSSAVAVVLSFFYPIIALGLIGSVLLLFLMPPATPVYDKE